VRCLRDWEDRAIRLTDERLQHILGHPEMQGMGGAIEEALADPDRVLQSLSDPEAHLYYRFYLVTSVGGKYLCVVVKIKEHDAFVLTGYLTDTVKKGRVIWHKRA
jgi:hypothetical protein